jgi:hypothetical protein
MYDLSLVGSEKRSVENLASRLPKIQQIDLSKKKKKKKLGLDFKSRYLSANFQPCGSSYTEKTFLPKWLEITSSSIFPAIWAGFLSSKSRNNGFPSISVGKSCSYSRKN